MVRFRMTATVLRQPYTCWMNWLEIWLLMTLLDLEAPGPASNVLPTRLP